MINNENSEKKNEKPLISIITVVLNGEKYIAQTIKSVIDQKQEGIEYILIDGGSTDDTLNIINKYKNSIDILVSEPDNGIYDAMNKGLELSSGKWVWFLNSDDYLEKDIILDIFLQKKGNYLNSYNIVYGNLRKIDEKYNYIVKKRNLLQTKNGISFNHPSTLIKGKLLKKLGGFNIKYRINSDYDLFLRLARIKLNILYVDKVFTNMRHGGTSERLSYSLKRIWERFLIDKENLSVLFALKNLFFYTIPGFIKKVFRMFLEKTGFSFLVDLYFKKKYRIK